MRAAIVGFVGIFALVGCATPSQAPEWFAERSAANDSGYPSLRDVPTTTTANTDAAYWDAVKADLVAAGQDVRSNPRSEPATAAENPSAFLDEARDDLEDARDAHE